MTAQQLNAKILKVAEATSQTKEQVAAKLALKDSWTWFLIEQAAI